MHHNIIIIGGGPAGFSAALYLARAGLKPLVFAGSPPGGQLSLTSEVENFPGHPSILGAELVDRMRKQAEKFGAIVRDENVKTVTFGGEVKRVNGEEGAAVIVATGAKALWLGLDSEKRLRGKGVSACATCDGFFFRNKPVAVIGGGDCALEEALVLTKFASKVYLIHRRNEFKASKIMQKQVAENKKIEIVWNAKVQEIMGEHKVEGLRLTVQNEEKIQPVSGIFVAIGHKPDTDLFKGVVELDEQGYIISTVRAALMHFNKKNETVKSKLFDVNYQTMTSVAGVFTAGDCADSVYKQASTAAGTGVQAALDAERWMGERLVVSE